MQAWLDHGVARRARARRDRARPVGRRGRLHRRLRGGDPLAPRLQQDVARSGRPRSPSARSSRCAPTSRATSAPSRSPPRAGSSTYERRPRASPDARRAHAPALGEHRRGRPGAADHGPRAERRRVVAHRARARAAPARHHVRQPRRRPLDARSATPTRPRRWPTTPSSVLDAAGVERAHVYGISLGGMVAQQLALRHPERVRSLVLGATQPGRPARGARPTPRCWRSSAAGWACAPEEAALGVRPVQLRPALPARARRRASRRTSRGGSRTRSASAPTARSCSRRRCTTASAACRASTSPTLVVHGAHDRVIPVANAQLLAERIPGARLRILEDSGHLYPTEEPEVDDAIARVPRRREGAAA